MRARSCHVALIIEDDPAVARVLKQLVVSLGHDWILATTLEELRAAVVAGGYCYVLLDMQIPAHEGDHESVGCGETGLRVIRRAAPERNGHDCHVVPVLVVTAFSHAPDFVAKVMKNGASDFIPKPFEHRLDKVLDQIRAALKDAEREEHEACKAAALAASLVKQGSAANSSVSLQAVSSEPVAPPPAQTLRLAIDGTYAAQRNSVSVNDLPGTLPDFVFVVLVSAISAHLRTPTEWQSATKLGMARNRWVPSRILKELKGLLPEGFRVIEGNKPQSFRLNPAIAVGVVDWVALTKHPNAVVRKVAAEWGRG